MKLFLLKKEHCIPCEVRTESLCAIEINFVLQRFNQHICCYFQNVEYHSTCTWSCSCCSYNWLDRYGHKQSNSCYKILKFSWWGRFSFWTSGLWHRTVWCVTNIICMQLCSQSLKYKRWRRQTFLWKNWNLPPALQRVKTQHTNL